MTSKEATISFPRLSKYNPEWILSSVSGGANALMLTEWLSQKMELKPGMRVLDLGCGRGASSIFLHREFGVQVWAVDLWFSPTENLSRIKDAGIGDGIYPLRVDARSLPFAANFFDAIVSIDSFSYFGTDDLYLASLAPYVRPGGEIGIAQAGLMREIDDEIPSHLEAWWSQNRPWCLHSAQWWHRHWTKAGVFESIEADDMWNGWMLWRDWIKGIAPDNEVELEALESDAGRYLGYVRAVGRRGCEEMMEPSTPSMPFDYSKKPLMRG